MNSLWSIISKKKTPSSPTYDKICDAFPLVNRGWLATGEGEMFIERPKETNKEDLTITSNQVIKELTQKLQEQSDLIISNMLRADLVHEAQMVISKLSSVLNDFENIKKQGEKNAENLDAINLKLTSIEFMETVKVIKKATKKRDNGGIDMN